MALSPTGPARGADLYDGFRFLIKWDGKVVAGMSKASGLKRTGEVVDHRAGGDASTSHKSPGRSEYEAITLDTGVTQDARFGAWASLVWQYGAGLGSEVSLANFRKDLYLEQLNEAAQTVVGYKVYRCWVSEYQALPDLGANANAVLIQHIKLENEGWDVDTSVAEPTEPRLGKK
jgi:phage tail-like protein